MYTHTLREIHVDAVIIDQNALHLEVGLFTILLMFKLNEGVL